MVTVFYHCKVAHPVFAWLVEHAADVLTKTEVGAGWRVTAALLIAMVVRVYMYNSDQKQECPSPHQLQSNLNSAVFV